MSGPLAPSFEAGAAAVAEHLRAIMVTVRTPAGGGSGTVWARDGLVVTNNHVVQGDGAEVVTHDGKRLAGRLAARDPSRDLATLRVDAVFGETAVARDTESLRVGEIVFAMGNPWGERGVLTRGIVVARGPATVENEVPIEEAIRADVRLAPGNSGGPLADSAGRVAGINSMIAGGMAIAVPSNAVIDFVEGKGAGFLGISGRAVPLPPAIAASYRAGDATGLLVTEVMEGSPASEAGLMPGDVVLQLDGAPAGLGGISRGLRAMRPGRPVHIHLLRGFERREADVNPVARV
ncbi:MAG: S1C family serine protease [Dehalococcoidia bacterium]